MHYLRFAHVREIKILTYLQYFKITFMFQRIIKSLFSYMYIIFFIKPIIATIKKIYKYILKNVFDNKLFTIKLYIMIFGLRQMHIINGRNFGSDFSVLS